jgi:hypothetical protein
MARTLERHGPLGGVLTSTSPVSVAVSHVPTPVTVTLNTTAAGKAIQISTNADGTLPFTPAYASSHPNQLIVVLEAEVEWVIFTGQSGDTWSIV